MGGCGEHRFVTVCSQEKGVPFPFMNDHTQDTLLRAVYRIADSRLQAAGEASLCTENVFCALAASAPDKVSYTQLAEFSNEDFLQAVYLTLLGRPVDTGALHRWRQHLQEPKEVFRSALLHSVLASPEYRSRSVLLTDCPLPVASAVPQLTVAASVQGLPPRLIRLYRMLPPFLQRLAKRIAGKE